MTFTKTLLAGLSALAVSSAAAFGVAQAQEAAPAPAPMEAPAAQAPDTSDEKLKSFAVAFLEVSKIHQTYQPQIEAAPTPEDQQRIRNEAGEQMMSAVNDAGGISVDEYNGIIQAAQVDPDLARRINTHINEAATGEQPAQPEGQPQQPAQ